MAATLRLTELEKICASSGIPLTTVALTCGVKASSLGAARQGTMRFSQMQEDALVEVAERLALLKTSLHPLQLPVDAGELQKLVRGFEDGVFGLTDIDGFKLKVGL